ncbi:MAG: hypothetical protein ABIR96_02335, partial [Bdellovibrionota bacterium]
MHKNEQSIVTSPLAAPTPLSRVRRRVWTVQKEPAPLPLGLTDRHILTGEELSFHEMKSILDFAIALKKQRLEGRSRVWL